MASAPVPEDPGVTPPRPMIGWRLLALFYDVWPVLALWMLASAVFTVGYYLAGHGARENIAPFSALQWLLWGVCWGLSGLYAVVSWRRGGQTLGMRPWRLRLVSAGGGPTDPRALWRRYAVGSLSLLAGGLGFWWAWFDRDRLTWHDRASGTRVVRDPPRERASRN
ncbi:RDD family protein [Marilutibacter aestuarii]|uniref:RDD family protein n=1 Tax=Marilutibacter aestuarii TaxID=1706195 RepID=A0A508AYD8_9GAMM|nr:RDD family protein [Lysobacter aestuarii]TQD50902.1 RDD family protein [Lysobacter aestuarii]